MSPVYSGRTTAVVMEEQEQQEEQQEVAKETGEGAGRAGAHLPLQHHRPLRHLQAEGPVLRPQDQHRRQGCSEWKTTLVVEL